MVPRRPLVLGALTAGLVLGACGATPGGTDDGGSTLSSGDDGGVLVYADVAYASAPAEWVRPVLDLYLPAEAGEPPLSVVVPDAGADPRGSDYAGLARDLARRGVAVAVVHWGVESPELTTVAGRPVDELVGQTSRTTAEVACALSVAAAQVGIREATSSAHPLVVVGHGLGANAAAMATLTTPHAFESCFAAARPPHVSAALLWDGDWLGARLGDVLSEDISGSSATVRWTSRRAYGFNGPISCGPPLALTLSIRKRAIWRNSASLSLRNPSASTT